MIGVRLGGPAQAFDGPLDLLLALVRHHQYPLDRLPIAAITSQYSAYLQEVKEADVEVGGEFIETVSWLVLLKSRALLPATAAEEPPEQELRRVLLDRATLQQTAALLGRRMEQAGLASGRPFRESPDLSQKEVPIPSIAARTAIPTVQDALVAARRAFAAVRARAQVVVPAPESYPVEAELCRILAELHSLAPNRAASTKAWFEARPAAEARVALLLALLELARLSKILLGQHRRFGPIYVKRVAG